MLHPLAPVLHPIPIPQAKPTGEYLLTSNNIRSPIERMTAIINRAARFRGLVYRAQELPFAGAHLGAGLRGAGRGVEEEADD
jgi:hypothetical protein